LTSLDRGFRGDDGDDSEHADFVCDDRPLEPRSNSTVQLHGGAWEFVEHAEPDPDSKSLTQLPGPGRGDEKWNESDMFLQPTDRWVETFFLLEVSRALFESSAATGTMFDEKLSRDAKLAASLCKEWKTREWRYPEPKWPFFPCPFGDKHSYRPTRIPAEITRRLRNVTTAQVRRVREYLRDMAVWNG